MRDLKRMKNIVRALEGLVYITELHDTPRNWKQIEIWTKKLNDLVFYNDEEECDGEPVTSDTFDYKHIVF